VAYDAVHSDIIVAVLRKNVLPPSFGWVIEGTDQYVSCVLLKLSYFIDPKQWLWDGTGREGVFPITYLRT